MSSNPLVVEKKINAPVSKVWQAITDVKQMNEWYFPIPAFEPVVGFSFNFTAGADNEEYLHLCKVTEVEFEKKLSYTWQYEVDPALTEVTFELFPEGSATIVRITHKGLDKLTIDNPNFKRESFEKGWTAIFGKMLPGYLEKKAG